MQAIIEIIKAHGGLDALRRDPISIDPPSDGYMRLCVELVGTGPRGGQLLSVAHYYEQNGDLMRDPEMVIEIPGAAWGPDGWADGSLWGPISFRQDSTGYSREAVYTDDAGRVMVAPAQVRDLRGFMRVWNRNIREQGFIKAFKSQSKARVAAN